ncbi:DUF4383 domain-containing protein [Streptomyces globisporus]|uniref:DUF4383 domain-containing protein n=1 Tax=Streptomyces globisporus TaxID=1908 RepID=A0ABN8VFW4_STRGL|nr:MULTISPECIES: DUF4383 domain-containing protein [Streptomyces]RDL04509.1 uncharacterized protein DUF4383 [Streptomyces sp. HB202]WSQ95468.1 DUF4383 domain-containing protein [Streptomyces globisporus]WSV93447.1 DUF4383 domain-containing protein [Streptomyces globisporus]CAH9419859.1 hypothetical protein SGL43_06915 [Streptomyces globisporus]GGW16666.1 hypothetical protein GCM10010264_69280 [Streptomyces globisporus]
MKLSDELPTDHHLVRVYRVGGAVCGCILLAFGCLGFADALSPFNTSGDRIAGMTTNIALSWVSVVVGLVLLAGAAVGGNFASTLNMTVGALFILSGFYHLFVLDRSANFLDFGMTNVVFSFLMGLLILTFGMYGRVSSKLSHDNPYWRRRHPREAAREAALKRRIAMASATDSVEQSGPERRHPLVRGDGTGTP